jgi:carboxypeptidase PM20D1
MRAALRALLANPQDPAALGEVTAETTYNSKLRTTCVATLLEGGHAENALPQRARATVNCRILPGTPPEQVQAELQRVVADPGVSVTPIGEIYAAPASPLREDVMTALRKAVDVRFPGLPILPDMAAGASDSTHFRAAGIDSYCVASVYLHPDDDFSHGLDERIPADAIPHALAFWRALLQALVDQKKGTAGSTDRCNISAQSFGWRSEAQRFPWALVQA